MPYVFNPFTGSLDNAPSTNKGDSAYTTVNSNSATWNTGESLFGNYLPLSGGTLTGKLTAGYTATQSGLNIGNGTVPSLPVIGDLWMQQYTLNWYSPAGVQAAAMANGANIFNRAQTIEVNDSTRSALRITQTGTNNALLVEDVTNPDSTPFVIDALGNVGVGLSAIADITAKMTIIGKVSATDIIYASGGNSKIWNETYTTVQSNSSSWASDSTTDTGVRVLTSNWESTYSTVLANSATWSAVNSYSSLIGDSTINPITATHNLNTKDIVFSIREISTDKIVYAAGRTIDNNNIELTFNDTPSINQYDLTILSRGNTVAGNGNATNVFALTTISSSNYVQNASFTHTIYNDTPSTGSMTVYLLPPLYHVGVTQHKKIGSTANVILSAPSGVLIDGYPTHTLTNQYESIGLYTDGTNYFIQ
jgi:hypothetical protein